MVGGELFAWIPSINFGSIIIGMLWTIATVIVVVVVAVTVKNRRTYTFKVRILRTRENRKVKEGNYKGGYIGRKNLSPFFRIKTGRFWEFWKYVDLIETPKPQYIDEEDRVYYRQIDVDSYIQMKRSIRGNELLFTPVESDVKYGAVLAIQRIKEALRVEPTWQKLLPYAGMTLLFLFAVIAYYYITKSCG